MAAARQRHLQLWLHVQLPISMPASARYDRHLKWEKKSEERKKVARLHASE